MTTPRRHSVAVWRHDDVEIIPNYQDAKRLIGRKFSDPTVKCDVKLWPFKVIPNPTDRPMMVVAYKGEEKQLTYEEISSMVLTKMKDTVDAYLGSTEKNVVVTLPKLTFIFLICVYAVRVGVINLLSGIGGSILSSIFIRNTISLGASSALFGLLGAMLSELFTNWTIYTNKAVALYTLIVIIAINLAVGILPPVDNFAHIGGFLSGFLLEFVLFARPQFGWLESRNRPTDTRLKSKYTVYQYVFWIAATILLIVGFIVGLVMLFKGKNANDKCSWCHYLSCVPTSRWSCDN
ncbi:RHOMBOID-like protein 3 [Salvia miltiorrhiza]|uniref:RHOMBOID-like protein 3 n=1 Tax=Salvia miltiorrhiza TaxID=226208 RepID=UPI0025AC7780|nr:RHOMBOID-like protein 3 [Salvia miltiorrhiza]